MSEFKVGQEVKVATTIVGCKLRGQTATVVSGPYKVADVTGVYTLRNAHGVEEQVHGSRLQAAAEQPEYSYCKGGAGFILHRGDKVIWETVTVAEMLRYLKDHDLRDVQYRTVRIVVIR